MNQTRPSEFATPEDAARFLISTAGMIRLGEWEVRQVVKNPKYFELVHKKACKNATMKSYLNQSRWPQLTRQVGDARDMIMRHQDRAATEVQP